MQHLQHGMNIILDARPPALPHRKVAYSTQAPCFSMRMGQPHQIAISDEIIMNGAINILPPGHLTTPNTTNQPVNPLTALLIN